MERALTNILDLPGSVGNVRVDDVFGYAVMAVEFVGPDWRYATLAFCTPEDRKDREWSRTRGLDVCVDRAKTEGYRLSAERHVRSVRELVLLAALRGDSYVPYDLRRSMLRAVQRAIGV